MSDLEIKSFYRNEYDYVLNLLEIFKRKHPESYAYVAEMGEEYRGHVSRTAQIRVLPPVPKP